MIGGWVASDFYGNRVSVWEMRYFSARRRACRVRLRLCADCGVWCVAVLEGTPLSLWRAPPGQRPLVGDGTPVAVWALLERGPCPCGCVLSWCGCPRVAGLDLARGVSPLWLSVRPWPAGACSRALVLRVVSRGPVQGVMWYILW